MTVTIIVDGKVWLGNTEVTDFTLFKGILTIVDKDGRESSISILRVESFVVTDY